MDRLQENLVSVVMRTVGGRPREIRRALSSIAANLHKPIEVLVVYQGRDSRELEFLHALQAEFNQLSLHLIQNLHSGDRRAENLNLGWEAAKGRYICFLDDDDSLEPLHFSLLLDALSRSNHVWAYAQVTLLKENHELVVLDETRPFRRHRFSVTDLWVENFIPIHSFLIDREKLVTELCERPFCEDLDRSEDWDFLIRLGFFHEPEVVDVFTCNYYVSTGARNTNLSLMEKEDQARQERNRMAWARCKVLVEERKVNLLCRVWWAKEIFAEVVSPEKLQIEQNKPTVKLGWKRRVLRGLIRRLEKLF